MPDSLSAKLQERAASVQRTLETYSVDDRVRSWTVDEFLAEDRLQLGDIVLYRRDPSMLSALVRWATGGLYSHAGMVHFTPRRDQGFDHYFIIESDQRGVDLTPLRQYMLDPRVSIAILRVPEQNSWSSPRLLKRMRGHMMERISDTYDFGAIEMIVRNFVGHALFGLQSLVRGSERTLASIRRRRPHMLPRAFICSGLVQLGYLSAVQDAIKQDQLPPEAIRHSIYRNDLIDWFNHDWSLYTDAGKKTVVEDLVATFEDDLRATTPADLEASENLDWQFVSLRGQVYAVSSRAEAEALLRDRRKLA